MHGDQNKDRALGTSECGCRKHSLNGMCTKQRIHNITVEAVEAIEGI